MGLGDYNAGNIKEGQIRISPSGISQLSDNEEVWYRSSVLKEKTFNGNTATRLGTLTHYRAEKYLKGDFEPNDSECIEWLERENEVDQWRVLDNSKLLLKAFIDGFKYDKRKCESEVWFEYEPNDELILSGTADIVIGDTIIDIKTTRNLKSSISDYRYQLYLLAYIAELNGREINNIGVIYLIEPNKSMGARYVEVIEPLDKDDLKLFVNWLKLKVKKIKLAKSIGDDWNIVMSKNLLSFRT